MRIISGTSRGTKLLYGSDIRPTRDFVKEAMFSILSNHVEWSDISVLDICAGSGSLGLEAYSRGCRKIIFVEPLADCLKQNLQKMRIDAKIITNKRQKNPDASYFHKFLKADWSKSNIESSTAALSEPNILIIENKLEMIDQLPHVNVAFFDPPYLEKDLYHIGLQKIQADIIVVEHDSRFKYQEFAWDQRKYGNTTITFLKPPARS